MKSSDYLATRLREVLMDGKWVTGTNWLAEIKDLSFSQATESINGLNSIAQLTFHITYYLKGVAQVFKGGKLSISDKYSFDTPPIITEQDWERLRTEFSQCATEFISLVTALSENTLNDQFEKPEYGTVRRNIDVMIEHTYYHFGQLLLIKKLMKQD